MRFLKYSLKHHQKRNLTYFYKRNHKFYQPNFEQDKIYRIKKALEELDKEFMNKRKKLGI
jgi:hypothetical protein